MKRHLTCAAAELPIATNELLVQEETTKAVIEELAAEASILLAADGSHWVGARKYPHREVDLRGTGHSFVIRNKADESVLGEIDYVRCFKECHPGAVYLHRGKTWLIKDLDLDGHEVHATRENVNYFTRTMGNKTTEILKIYETVSLKNLRASFGYLRVTDTVTGYQRRLVAGQKLIGTESLDLPPLIFETEDCGSRYRCRSRSRLKGNSITSWAAFMPWSMRASPSFRYWSCAIVMTWAA